MENNNIKYEIYAIIEIIWKQNFMNKPFFHFFK